jgi:protein-tyrosine-phosphatase
MAVKKILFMCKWNRFRSRIALAYFKKAINSIKGKKPSVIAKSAGLIRGTYPLSENQVSIAKKYGLDIKGKPEGISHDLLRWADVLVIVADDVPESIFKGKVKQIITWKISDSTEKDRKKIDKIIKATMLKVDGLIKRLK